MLGARRLLRVGTCGALGEDLVLGQLLVAVGRAAGRRDEPRARRDRPARARPGAARSLAGARRASIVSSDLFYDPDPARADGWRAAGAVAVEMEAATLFAIAARHGSPRPASAWSPTSSPRASGSATRRCSPPRRRWAASRSPRSSTAGGDAARSRGLAALRRALRGPSPPLLRLGLRLGGAASTSRRSCSRWTSAGRASIASDTWPTSLTSLESWPSIAATRSASPGRRLARGLQAGGELVDAVLQAVERLLDALEARADGAQAPGQAVDVGRRRQVERAHRGLLRGRGLLARGERPA